VIRLTIYCLTAIAFFTSCDPFDDRLILVNNSSDTVFYMISKTDEFHWYSPAEYDSLTKKIVADRGTVLMPDSNVRELAHGKWGWSSFVDKSQDSILRVFFFSKKLVQEHPWDSIASKKLYS